MRPDPLDAVRAEGRRLREAAANDEAAADELLLWLDAHADDLIYRALRELSEITEEVRTLRLLVAVNEDSRIPDGHTRIDGKLFRLERHGDLNRYGLVRVRPEENPDV